MRILGRVMGEEIVRVRIIYFAMVATVFIYGGIIHLLRPPAGATLPYPLRDVFLGLACLTAAGALFVRHRLATEATPPRNVSFYVMSFALSETPALFGLVLHFLGGSRELALGLVFASLCVLLLCYPRQG